MTAQKSGGVQWRHTPVLIRADIFAAAHERGLNFSHECNRALADLVCIDYDQQQLPEEAPAEPVILAQEQVPIPPPHGPGTGRKQLRPVINADDPATPAQVLKLKKARVAHPAHVDAPAASLPAHAPSETRAGLSPKTPEGKRKQKKAKKAAAGIKRRGDAIKRFVTTKLARTDTADGEKNTIAKDELYQLFVWWCRANTITPAPDKRSFSIALKTRFVMQDGSVNSTPCWINVKLR